MLKLFQTFILLLTLTNASNAQEGPKHPEGAKHWYPIECCNLRHCGPVPCSELHKRSDGSYNYFAKELNKTLLFEKSKIKPSPDESCHVCYRRKDENSAGFTYCAFIKTMNMF